MATSVSSPDSVAQFDQSTTATLATESSNDTIQAERKYVSHACEACRSRRSKVRSTSFTYVYQRAHTLVQCDGQLPMCSACSRRQTTCSYSEVDRRRGKLKKNETDALQEKVKSLESIIRVLSLASDDDARGLLRTLREKAPTSTTGGGLPAQLAEVVGDWNVSRQKDVEYHPEVGRRSGVYETSPGC